MKDEALRLAEALAVYLPKPQDMNAAAAELRRLYLVEQALERCRTTCDATSEGWRADAEEWKAQRDALLAENESLKRTLAASCDEERQQLYEAGPGGGCSRALSAEFQRDALLEALKELVGHNKRFSGGVWDRARAVIKNAEGEKT